MACAVLVRALTIGINSHVSEASSVLGDAVQRNNYVVVSKGEILRGVRVALIGGEPERGAGNGFMCA